MKIIRNQAIDKALESEKRVYLVGNLAFPTALEGVIGSDNSELGITDYKKYALEKPHHHATNVEYNYVIKGSVKGIIIKEEKEYIFNEGDLYVIMTNEAYITKAKKGTKVIFSKVPGGNDKVVVDIKSKEIEKWGQDFDASYNK